MLNYDEEWPDFMKGQPLHINIDYHKELSDLATKYKTELNELLKLKAAQQPLFLSSNRMFGANWAAHYDKQINDLTNKTKADFKKIIEKATQKEKAENPFEKAKMAGENREDVTKDKREPEKTKEEKLAAFKENFKEETKEKQSLKEEEKKNTQSWSVDNKEKDAEKKVAFEDNREDMLATGEKAKERARMIAEIKAAQERNREQERER